MPHNNSLQPWKNTRTPAQTAHLPWRAVPGGAGSATEPGSLASSRAFLRRPVVVPRRQIVEEGRNGGRKRRDLLNLLGHSRFWEVPLARRQTGLA